MVLNKPFPPDIRVEKETRSLTRAGHEVHLVCIGDANETETIEGVAVHRLFFDRSSVIKRMLNSRKTLNYFYIKKWCRELLELHRREKFSLFHAHDLPTAPYSLLAGKRADIPVVLDMHENYPEALRTYMSFSERMKPTDLFLNNASVHRLVERISIAEASHVITVVEERKRQLVDQGFEKSRISVVSNSVDVENISRIAIREELMERYDGRFVVTYIGGFGPHRGLETLIESAAALKEHIPNVLLLLVGGRGSALHELKGLCRRMQVEEYAEFAGWVDFSEIPSYISLSNICTIPHIRSGHTDTTVPHKLFQYMFFAKPVITTDCLPLKRIIGESECGIIVRSGDCDALTSAILDLYSDSGLAEKCGRNGRRAVLEKYNWKMDEKKLLSVYDRLLSEKKTKELS